MRELTGQEINNVGGGIGVIGATIGAAVGMGGAIVNGKGIGDVLVAGLLGGLGGFAGGMAGSAAAGGFFVRMGWGIRSVGLGVASGEVASQSES